ncbi:farnesoate epoxidase-like [Pollicipes pollicipes]|uniref:farnesoate epoxidase-like n=1 Tax=Pollicipes pollicipes TaxID=41117 RepID=UPI001884B7D7|nr:farnesoate epoxidase-like [Pollicipes pollicipes]
MAQPEANGRAAGSSQMALSFGRKRGVVVAEGERWARNSGFLLAALDHMLESGEAERMICDELEALEERLRDLPGPLDVQTLFRRPYVSLSWRIVTGQRFLAGQAERITALFQAEMAAFQNSWVDNRLLRALFPERSGFADVLRFRDEVRRLFAAAVTSGGEGREGTLVSRLRAERGADWDPATDEDLVMFFFDFLNAGCETTSSFNEWALLYLLREPEQQALVRRELKALGRPATAADRERLPRTRAFLAEVFRRSSLTPAGVPHRATGAFSVEGYRVPADTVLRYGILASHWSDALWQEPERFRPERFLRDGAFVPNADLVPYGIGPRVCTGRRLAELYNFLSVTRLLQRFELAPPDGAPPPGEDAWMGLSRNCRPFQLELRPR